MKPRKKEYYEYDPDTNTVKPMDDDARPRFDKWKIFKQAVAMGASGCASMVVNRYLKANVPAGGNAFETVAMSVGVYFITGVVGASVAKYAEDELDGWRDSVKKIKEGHGNDGQGE